MSRQKIKEAMLWGLKRLLTLPRINKQKVQMRIDNIEWVVDFAIKHQRNPTDYEIQQHLAEQGK